MDNMVQYKTISPSPSNRQEEVYEKEGRACLSNAVPDLNDHGLEIQSFDSPLETICALGSLLPSLTPKERNDVASCNKIPIMNRNTKKPYSCSLFKKAHGEIEIINPDYLIPVLEKKYESGLDGNKENNRSLRQ